MRDVRDRGEEVSPAGGKESAQAAAPRNLVGNCYCCCYCHCYLGTFKAYLCQGVLRLDLSSTNTHLAVPLVVYKSKMALIMCNPTVRMFRLLNANIFPRCQ